MTEAHGALQLRKVLFELRFHPSLLFYDKVNEIGLELNELYANWQRDWHQIRFTDSDTFSSFLIAHDRIASEMDAPESFGAFKSRVLRGRKAYIDGVPIDKIHRAGVRFLWICPVDFPFDELSRIIQGKFYQPRPELSEVLVPEFKDVAFFLDFEKKEYSFHLRFGPVKKEEIPQRIIPTQLVVGEPKRSENPDVAIFYDIDCYTEAIQISGLEVFLDEGHSSAREMASGITKYILEA
jgi:hypothetical protein